MIKCDYILDGQIISKENLYKALNEAVVNEYSTIEDVLYSLSDKRDSRLRILESIKHEGQIEEDRRVLLDGDVSYSSTKALSISAFLDSPLAVINGNPIYTQKDIEDYRKEELDILMREGLSEEEARRKIEKTIESWERIAEDGKILHLLCVDQAIGYHSRDWDVQAVKFAERARTLISKDSPLNNESLLINLYKTFAIFYRNTKGNYEEVIKNIGLTAKLKELDQELFGHIDYAFIDAQGNLHLYNFKVTHQSPSKWVQAKRTKYQLEGAFLKQMLIANGIYVSNIGEIEYNIVPLQVYYNDDFTKISRISIREIDKIRDYYESQYSARNQDNIAKHFIEVPFGIENVTNVDESDNIFELAFQQMKISPERVYKSALQWIKEAPSYSDTDSLIIREVNEPDCRYKVWLYGEEHKIKDFTVKENNQEIIKLVTKALNKLNSELGDYSSKIAIAINKAFKHKLSRIEDLENATFITRVLAKYLPKGKDSPLEWEFNDELIEYNILLFKNTNTGQLDIVTLSAKDLQAQGDFRRGATNILGTFKLDGNKDASTLKGDMGNIELMRGMILLNQILPNLNNPKLGEIIVLSSSKSGQSRRHYIENFNKLYFQHFLQIIKQENKDELKDLQNNISKASFSDPIDDIVNTFQLLMEEASEAQQNLFENMNFSQLSTLDEKSKVGALFDLMEELNNTFLNKKTPEEIYDLAHPRLGIVPTWKEHTAALLYELVSSAYHYYSGQNIQYEKDLSMLDRYSFTAPTIPDYNIRLVVNNMQTTLDAIAYIENNEYEKNIFPIVMEYYKACGYSDVQNLVIGNQLHLFDNLYQTDENGNRLLIFKNPYDETNDLKPHERVFLKKALFYLNKVKSSRFAKSKELFTHYNDPKIAEYINGENGESYLWVPLVRASKPSQRQQSISDRVERIKRGFRIASKSKDWYTEVVSQMTQEERKLMDEDIKALSLRNPFDIGDLNINRRNNYIANEGVSFFETNVENILTEYMSKAVEVEKLNKFLVATKSILLQLYIMGQDSKEAQQIIEKEQKVIQEYITQNVFNTSTMDPTNQKIVAGLSGLKSNVTFMNLAGNMVSFFRDTINGFMENYLRSYTKFQTDINASSLTAAYQYVMTNARSNAMDINLLSKLNIRYRLSNTDLARIKERLRTGRNGMYNWDNWAYATLRSPDFLNRMVLFVGRCMQDGVFEAYSLKDGELYYDVTKDKRFTHFINDNYTHPEYAKQKALFILHVKNWNKEHPSQPLDWADKKLPEPYSDQEILAIKNLSNNIYGSYDKSLKAQYEHTAIGWAFTMYTTWMNGMWNNWFMKPGEYNIHQMETRIQQDGQGHNIYMMDNGNLVTEYIDEQGNKTYILEETGEQVDASKVVPVLEQVPIIVQGVWYTLKDAFQVLRDEKSLKAAIEYVNSNEVDKRNIRQARASLLIALLFALLFKHALTPAYNESKKKSNDLSLGAKLFASLTYRSLNGARDSFAGPLNVIEYFGEQLDPPIYRVPIKLMKDAGKTIFGDKTFLSLITGNIALFRTYKDII